MEEETLQIYPVYSQTFQEIREKNLLYIDKTDLVYKMIHPEKKYVFLSRPRRFGKSLLVTTLKAYFEGKKDLFKGLAIEKLEKEWIEYPVLHFDMYTAKSNSKEELISALSKKLRKYEEIYGRDNQDKYLKERFEELIERAYKKTGKKVVILIDEYDAPILHVINKDSLEDIRGVMRDFFTPLKSNVSYIKFVFLTGITKFSQLSIFSELNNIENISMDDEFASICGITHDEMLIQLKPGIENLAKKKGITFQEAIEDLKSTYDGYHFTQASPDIYNPYSLLNALKKEEIKNYWFESGTPTFLIETLSFFGVKPEEIGNICTDSDAFNAPVETMTNSIPLLYQAGYLTIKEFDSERGAFLLDMPNKEVREGLMKSLLPSYLCPKVGGGFLFAKDIGKLINLGKMEEALDKLQSYLKGVAYMNDGYSESFFRSILFMIFNIAGLSVFAEVPTSDGREDLCIFTSKATYVIELKYGKSAEETLQQINRKAYADAYLYLNIPIVKVGINFDKETHTIDKYIVERVVLER